MAPERRGRRSARWLRVAMPGWLLAVAAVGAIAGVRLLDDVHGQLSAAALEVLGIVVLVREGARRRARAVRDIAQRAEVRYGSLVNGASDLIAVVSARGQLTYVSPASRRLLGVAPDEMVGSALGTLVHPDDVELAATTFRRLLEGEQQRTVVVRVRHRSGGWRYLECLTTNLLDEPTIEGVVWNCRDVTEHQVLDDRLIHQAYHDPLTSLPNRLSLTELIDRELAEPRALPVLALLMVEIGRLDAVTETHGHLHGDQVVLRCAQRLARATHADDVLARVDDHTFGIWCRHAADSSAALGYGQEVAAAMVGPFSVAGVDVDLSCSVAVATASVADGRMDALEVVRRVDGALMRARRDGTTRIYDERMGADIARLLELEALVGRVIAAQSVALGYQPIVRLDDLETVAAEALLRVTDAHGTAVPALEVTGAAKRCGRLGELSDLVLRTACADAARWRRLAPERSIGVSVNISPAQLDDPTLPTRVRNALEATGLDPASLHLEITESALMEDPIRSARLLTALKLLGVRLSAADFGTGHSSLAYLRTFPLDVVKLDRTFVAGLPGNLEDFAITRAIVVMADALGLMVVAEGIEDEAQRATLLEMGIGCGQGFLWSPAVPAVEFEARLLGELDSPRISAVRPAPPPSSVPSPAAGASAEERMHAVLEMLAHEIRGPLTVVTGYASLIEKADDPDHAKAAAAISRASVRIARILTDVVESSRRAESMSGAHVQEVPAGDLVAGIVADLASSTHERLAITARPDRSVVVAVDAVQMGQVIGNLVNNAIKFSPADTLIEVAVTATDTTVDIAVSDEGPGIDVDDLGHIFRKYGRGDHRHEGTGLGLYVARRIARTHGGDLLYRRRVSSPGSTFTLRLPRAHHDAGRPVARAARR